MSTVRRTIVRAAAVTACAGSVLALPAAAALADGLPAAASAQAAAAPRTLVKSLTLADGVSTAHVYRVAAGSYQADIQRHGVKVATLASHDGAPAYGHTGGLHLALRPDGRLSSWSADTPDGAAGGATGDQPVVPAALSSGADGHKTAHRTGFAEAATTLHTGTGIGAGTGTGTDRTADAAADRTVALRLGTLTGAPDDGVLLIAAGGGMAAIGAAGLGFAMLRRGRTEA
ncbi:hypothetical protein OHS33_24815 [Streptomyces sp. NBC_00536]|uniref:hypothetical protein n=1 Tax=Streptomyces sp. NBC_00536 TaxID=2975769 RepID=UPI002E7FF740|nr:hypothetical protein [Streptomyces sp. NBC_00536]WUC81273.1 hypothetical protein OHS33_24815 [Streptomyces sp. NBC_00536]